LSVEHAAGFNAFASIGTCCRPTFDDGTAFVAVNAPIAIAATAKTPQSAIKRR
jgi:hypothetical protein